MSTNEQNNANEGQSRAGEAGANLTVGLGADFDDAEERYINQTLALLRDGYEKAAKPYMDRLAVIHSRKPLRIVVTVAEAEAMGFNVPNNRISEPCKVETKK